ncbi:MAG: RDD family protein [Flavobacteriaceae bacterium]
MDGTIIHGYKLASKSKRLFASLIEGVIYMLLVMVVFLGIGKSFVEYLNRDFEFLEIVYSAMAGIVIGGIFYPLFSGNLGHRILNIKVISEETGEDYNKAEKGAIRECLKYVLAYLIIPILWILWDTKNQNLYDKLTKTLVVEKNKK